MIPFLREPTRVYALDGSGRLVAEITFPETAPGVYTIDHTFVDASLRGQGVADQLVARRPGADPGQRRNCRRHLLLRRPLGWTSTPSNS